MTDGVKYPVALVDTDQLQPGYTYPFEAWARALQNAYYVDNFQSKMIRSEQFMDLNSLGRHAAAVYFTQAVTAPRIAANESQFEGLFRSKETVGATFTVTFKYFFSGANNGSALEMDVKLLEASDVTTVLSTTTVSSTQTSEEDPSQLVASVTIPSGSENTWMWYKVEFDFTTDPGSNDYRFEPVSLDIEHG